MEVCDGSYGRNRTRHNEVAYSSSSCPVCEVIEELENSKKEITALEETRDDLEAEKEELEKRISEIERLLAQNQELSELYEAQRSADAL